MTNLQQQRQWLERLRRHRTEAEALLRIEEEIAREKALAHKARLELRRRTETPAQKAEREEFQRKQAIYCDCPEMDPDWRDQPRLSHPGAHKGGSAS